MKKLLGHDPKGLIEEGRQKEKEGDIGGAVLSYERALGETEEGDQAEREELKKHIGELRDKLSDKYIAEAQDYITEHEMESAVDVLSHALDVSGTEAKKGEIRKKLEFVQLMIADSQISEPAADMTEEEIYQALSGSWTQQQIDEFDEYGEKFKKAYLQFHGGDFDGAIAVYRELLEEAGEDALYLRLEYGRALYLKARARLEAEAHDDDALKLREEAIEVIQEFRKILPKRKTPEVRAQAWSLLAQIYMDKEDHESAEDALMEAQNVIPEEPTVYLNLGRFLYNQDRLEDAVYALEQGEKLMDKFHPDIELLLLLGTASRQTGDTEKAVASLEAIIDYYMRMGRHEWDPAVARPLAEMYEETGKILEACDMYRNLSTGGDKENLALYNYHAARLMKKLDPKDKNIRLFVLRAKERAEDEELKKKIEELENE